MLHPEALLQAPPSLPGTFLPYLRHHEHLQSNLWERGALTSPRDLFSVGQCLCQAPTKLVEREEDQKAPQPALNSQLSTWKEQAVSWEMTLLHLLSVQPVSYLPSLFPHPTGSCKAAALTWRQRRPRWKEFTGAHPHGHPQGEEQRKPRPRPAKGEHLTQISIPMHARKQTGQPGG